MYKFEDNLFLIKTNINNTIFWKKTTSHRYIFTTGSSRGNKWNADGVLAIIIVYFLFDRCLRDIISCIINDFLIQMYKPRHPLLCSCFLCFFFFLNLYCDTSGVHHFVSSSPYRVNITLNIAFIIYLFINILTSYNMF